jgi:hypothetical protein
VGTSLCFWEYFVHLCGIFGICRRIVMDYSKRKELVRFAIFIVDAINIGHEN